MAKDFPTIPSREQQEYDKYQRGGGTLPFEKWWSTMQQVGGWGIGATPISREQPTTEDVKTPAPFTYEIRNINGWWSVVELDEDGNVTGLDPIASADEGMSGYQQAQIALQEKELQWRMQQQPEQESYDDYKRRLLSELTQPSDWINRWMVQQTGGTTQQRAQESAVQAYQEQIGGWQEKMAVDPQADLLARVKENEQIIESILTGNLDEMGRPIKQPTQATPSAPAWLQQFTPGQTAGQPITKGVVTQPSMQQWASTPWSQRQGLSGYMDWAGQQSYRDMLDRMAMALPETPRGAGATRWSPAAQRG